MELIEQKISKAMACSSSNDSPFPQITLAKQAWQRAFDSAGEERFSRCEEAGDHLRNVIDAVRRAEYLALAQRQAV